MEQVTQEELSRDELQSLIDSNIPYLSAIATEEQKTFVSPIESLVSIANKFKVFLQNGCGITDEIKVDLLIELFSEAANYIGARTPGEILSKISTRNTTNFSVTAETDLVYKLPKVENLDEDLLEILCSNVFLSAAIDLLRKRSVNNNFKALVEFILSSYVGAYQKPDTAELDVGRPKIKITSEVVYAYLVNKFASPGLREVITATYGTADCTVSERILFDDICNQIEA